MCFDDPANAERIARDLVSADGRVMVGVSDVADAAGQLVAAPRKRAIMSSCSMVMRPGFRIIQHLDPLSEPERSTGLHGRHGQPPGEKPSDPYLKGDVSPGLRSSTIT